MANNNTHLVFGACPLCGEETTAEIDDATYSKYQDLLNADDVDFDDYIAAFPDDRKLAGFLYCGLCENHANIK
ncbi:hypothetical protein [Pseudoscardovia radai]|uniref:hypothetical protein n=1 Tax=Pseudoscardovia radai TaxID=987066 RepID=UPI003991CD99